MPLDYTARPPGGRRAFSTGGISLSSSVNAQSNENLVSRQPLQPSGRLTAWNQETPVPPPPPGPPPQSSGRSHSLNRCVGLRLDGAPVSTAESSRRPAATRLAHTNTLGPVPPTPAGWIDEIPSSDLGRSISDVPRSVVGSQTAHEPPSTLTRQPAQRDISAHSILERRSKSGTGAGKETAGDSEQLQATNAKTFRKPPNLVLSPSDTLLRRRQAERTGRDNPSSSPESTRHHTPLNISTLTPPYTPSLEMHRRAEKKHVGEGTVAGSPASSRDPFVKASLERFHMFIQQEASSPTDKVRLELFTTFMVHESRIRRDIYSGAFQSMASDIMELTRDMWRPLHTSPTQIIETGHPVSETPYDGPRDSHASNMANNANDSSCSSATEFTPATDTESLYDSGDHGDDRPPATPWGERFQPSLSPICSVPSMAFSAVPDEQDSRGRSASRWWEGSGQGSIGHAGQTMEMSKQESKYMSLHPNELIAPPLSSPSHSTPTQNTTQTSFHYGPDEYPPEKTDQRDRSNFENAIPSDLSYSGSVGRGKRPALPPLEISRLVTLPPPYPRHYPALQNNHPSLSTIRAKHREIVEAISMRQSQPQDDGYWHDSVSSELTRVCEGSITELVARLDESAQQNEHATAAQTEGDERPELLEQLTLLKWLFEAREQLQKQDFDAAMHRRKTRSNARIDDCRARGEYQQQLDEEARQAQQSQQDQYYYAEQATNRFSQLLHIVERHVSRGVEVQLSAFWDIAPPLLEVVQKIPAQKMHSLASVSMAIPMDELDENPSYRQFPLQYLLRMLTHAKKSAYQFIESQTNLLCLLHEVRTAASSADLRLAEIRNVMEGMSSDATKEQMMVVKRRREEEETAVLKERVGFLEGQWECALGEEFEMVLDRVGVFLKEHGGWDDGLDI